MGWPGGMYLRQVLSRSSCVLCTASGKAWLPTMYMQHIADGISLIDLGWTD